MTGRLKCCGTVELSLVTAGRQKANKWDWRENSCGSWGIPSSARFNYISIISSCYVCKLS